MFYESRPYLWVSYNDRGSPTRSHPLLHAIAQLLALGGIIHSLIVKRYTRPHVVDSLVGLTVKITAGDPLYLVGVLLNQGMGPRSGVGEASHTSRIQGSQIDQIVPHLRS